MVETGGEGADTLIGTPQDDTLRGGAGADRLIGDAGDDLLEGDAGNDTLRGDRGFDTLRGGAGDDTYLIADLDDYWVEEADGGFDRLIVSVNGAKLAPDVMQHIESVEYVDDALPLAYWVDALVFGTSWDLMGEPVTVRYAFLESSSEPGFSAFDESDRATARAALELWAAPTRLTWQEVSPEQADVVLGFADLAARGAAGVTIYVPGPAPSEIYVDDAARFGGLASDDDWFDVLLHEIGHGLWLKHPGDYNGSDGHGEPPFLSPPEDHDGLTVMSYHAAPAGQAMNRQLRPYDVAAAQYLYGVNAALNAGDTRYRVAEMMWPNNIVADGGGIDTLDASGVIVAAGGPAVVLDLRSGAMSRYASVDAWRLGDPGAFSIGYHTQIEHAVGSPGADRIFGNEGGNRLDGGAGDDTIDGARGRDTLVGGDGNDLLIMRRPLGRGAPPDPTVIDGGGGHDTLQVQFTHDAESLTAASELKALHADPARGGRFAALGIEVTGIEQVAVLGASGQSVQNVAPFALPLALSIDEDTPLFFDLPESLDIEGDALGYFGLGALEGVVTQVSAGDRHGLVFTPSADFNGTANVRYIVQDGAGNSVEGVVVVEVRPVDDAPVLRKVVPDRTATVGQPFSATIEADTFSDVDSPVTYSARLGSGAALPSWLVFDSATRSFGGTPAADDIGLLQVALWANAESVGTAEVFLLGVYAVPNALPSGRDAAFSLAEDTLFVERLPAATDADGDPLGYELAGAPASGQLALQADGRFEYRPAAEFNGTTGFDYLVSDGRGGMYRYHVTLTVTPVDDPPLGSVTIDGTVRAGFPLLALNGFSDADGLPPQFSYTWLRNGEPVPGASRQQYDLAEADIGTRIAVRVGYMDGSGFAAALTSAETAPVLGAQAMLGSAGNDQLYDTLGADDIDAGDGNDDIASWFGADTIDGGAGWDTLRLASGTGAAGLSVDLASGIARQGDRELHLRSIEIVVGSSAADSLAGSDADAMALQELFVPGDGNDTVNGRGGVDAGQIGSFRFQLDLQRSGNTITLRRDGDTAEVDTLIDIERLRFHDVYLAFGNRAEEVAKVAFALWSPAIAGSRYLFARGISYYDVGYRYETMIDAALGFFTSDTPQQFAERLAGNVASGRTAAEILALMSSHGGAAAGEAGRAYATKLVADDAANLRAIELAGLLANGIACDLYADGNLLFAPIGG